MMAVTALFDAPPDWRSAQKLLVSELALNVMVCSLEATYQLLSGPCMQLFGFIDNADLASACHTNLAKIPRATCRASSILSSWSGWFL
jgi:hypothetical protein